jgi:hypothetical protein
MFNGTRRLQIHGKQAEIDKVFLGRRSFSSQECQHDGTHRGPMPYQRPYLVAGEEVIRRQRTSFPESS